MASVGTYFNFAGNTAEAFETYRTVFGTEYAMGPTTFGEAPDMGGAPLAPGEESYILNVALPTVGGHMIMGTDILPSQGHSLRVGNNVTVLLDCDDLQQAQGFYAGLADGATETVEIQEMPWGQNWGVLLDRFQVRWMITAPLAGE